MKAVKIAGRRIGPDDPCFVIAEAGVNHNGDPEVARELVHRAKRCGADCVKFQTFRAEGVVSRDAPKADYQLKVTDPAESQFAMLKALELSPEAHQRLMDQCAAEGIVFLSTPYSVEDARMLAELGVSAFKIASGQIVELAFLETVARLKRPMIVSTGMSTLSEVERAVEAIRGAGNADVVLLQCTTDYPSRPSDANLRAMDTLAQAFDCLVGYSDHTEGTAVALASVARGARVVEKHFTLDRSQPGPDHLSSVDPEQLCALVAGIREVEAALGHAVKKPTEAEVRNAVGMRRSIAAVVDIAPGTRIDASMLTLLRPRTGIAPDRLVDVVGRVSAVAIPARSLLSWEQLRA